MKTKKNKAVENFPPFVLWLTGLSGSGKSTLAQMVHDYFLKKGCKVEWLDGDKVRSVFPNTGFSKEERDQHIKRIGFAVSLLEKNGVIVIASFISPYREARAFVRGMCRNFIEVYLSAPDKICEQRDVKGLYKKARRGEIKNFTGIADPYEPPDSCELVVDTSRQTPEKSFEQIKNYLTEHFSS
jgi:adenylylsulfate kinase